ncbi:hypothetical protein WJX74_002428 [Apatococcus lobatus]|uniref:RRM domain-containing protein n=1 Tax=Apatococcus lobatus TaxID=904363 RepID=A0AAW1RHE4_9CHLO
MNPVPYGAPFFPPRPGMPPPAFFPRPLGPPLAVYPPGIPLPQHYPPGSVPLMRPPVLSGNPQSAAPVVLPKPADGPGKSSSLVPKQTTLYVGKIAPTVDDNTIKSLMETCGPVKSWKRLQDAETKQPKGFGFCEYEEAEGVLAAMRLLNNLKLDGQELLLKLNTSTQKYVDEYRVQQEREAKLRQITSAAAKTADGAAEKGKGEEEGKEGVEEGEEESDDSKDTVRLEAIMTIVSERATQGLDTTAATHASEFLSSMQQQQQQHQAADGHRGPPRTKSSSRPVEDAAAQLDKQMARERDRERREEEQRAQLEERMFKDKLRDWERHERDVRQARTIEKEKAKDSEKERARQIRADLEPADSDDEDYWVRQPYSSSRRAEDRRRNRIQEVEADNADRNNEESERAAKRLRTSPEPDGSADASQPSDMGRQPSAARSGDSGQVRVRPMQVDPHDPIYQAMIAAAKAPTPPPAAVGTLPAPAAAPAILPGPPHHSRQSVAPPLAHDSPAPPKASASQPPPRRPLLSAFGNDEEEDQPRRRLVPLQYSEEELRAVQQAEQATAAGLANPAPEDFEARKRSIIDSLPSSQKDVFAFAVNWDAFSSPNSAVAGRIRTYVSKKIAELLGEEEQTLVDFVMEKLQEHAQAQQMLNELVERWKPATPRATSVQGRLALGCKVVVVEAALRKLRFRLTLEAQQGKLLVVKARGKVWELSALCSQQPIRAAEGGTRLPFYPPEAVFLVVQIGDCIGFRSLTATGRTLQAVKDPKAPHQVANFNTGSWESWKAQSGGLVNLQWDYKMLDMDVQEVRVVSVVDMRSTERQALHAFRKAHTEVNSLERKLNESEKRLGEMVAASHRQISIANIEVEELRLKCERSHRGQQLAEVAAAQQAAALRQLELRLAQLSTEKENVEQAFDHASDRLLRQEMELNEYRQWHGGHKEREHSRRLPEGSTSKIPIFKATSSRQLQEGQSWTGSQVTSEPLEDAHQCAPHHKATDQPQLLSMRPATARALFSPGGSERDIGESKPLAAPKGGWQPTPEHCQTALSASTASRASTQTTANIHQAMSHAVSNEPALIRSSGIPEAAVQAPSSVQAGHAVSGKQISARQARGSTSGLSSLLSSSGPCAALYSLLESAGSSPRESIETPRLVFGQPNPSHTPQGHSSAEASGLLTTTRCGSDRYEDPHHDRDEESEVLTDFPEQAASPAAAAAELVSDTCTPNLDRLRQHDCQRAAAFATSPAQMSADTTAGCQTSGGNCLPGALCSSSSSSLGNLEADRQRSSFLSRGLDKIEGIW